MKKELFAPAELGAIQCRNRIIRSATFEAGGAYRGEIMPFLKDAYTALRDGGIGAIITGCSCIGPTGAINKSMVQVQHPTYPARFAEIADMLHEKQCPVIVQLSHSGSRAHFLPDGMHQMMPSDYQQAQAMTEAEIAATVRDFAVSAKICKEAGADGVQLHAAHGYLISAFLSPFMNHRTDAYGGSIENRARFLFEIYDAVRSAVGADFPIWMKINGEDLTAPGMTTEEFLWVCTQMAKRGVNAIEVSSGLSEIKGTSSSRKVVRPEDEGYNLPYAAALAKAVSIPIICVGGFRNVDGIERALESSGIAAVSLSRPLICEPALPDCWRSDPAASSKCVSCGKCFASMPMGCPMTQNG